MPLYFFGKGYRKPMAVFQFLSETTSWVIWVAVWHCGCRWSSSKISSSSSSNCNYWWWVHNRGCQVAQCYLIALSLLARSTAISLCRVLLSQLLQFSGSLVHLNKQTLRSINKFRFSVLWSGTRWLWELFAEWRRSLVDGGTYIDYGNNIWNYFIEGPAI